MDQSPFIRTLTPELEARIRRNPSLNIDTFIIPSPFIKEKELDKDYEHSYVWDEEGELLGYLLVYSNPDRSKYHIYKQVTSPFGRGKGIGTTFLQTLASRIAPEALVYLFIWEKQTETTQFFINKGFAIKEQIVYRKLMFHYLAAEAGQISTVQGGGASKKSAADELGKTRHDARKTLRLLSDMVDMLAVDNCNRIIEDINRETTALINTLNAYRDTVENLHDVDLKQLVFERVVPAIQLSQHPCEVQVSLKGRIPLAQAHFLDVSRALINLVSNSLDAIREADRPGKIAISLERIGDRIQLVFEDNGIGIEAHRLIPGPDGLPQFFGRTTKGSANGEGVGTRQICNAFGREHIRVESRHGEYTRWVLSLPVHKEHGNATLRNLEARHREFQELVEFPGIDNPEDRALVGSLIWQTRKMELFTWELILQFSQFNNIRELFRDTLAFRFGGMAPEKLRQALNDYRVDHPELRVWLFDTLLLVKRNEAFLAQNVDMKDYAGYLLKSYGQSVHKTVIFTMDPETGRFFATDRKLAEHVDFAQYLGRERDQLMRGEFSGDLKNPDNPISLGVWIIKSRDDAMHKLRMMQKACRAFLDMGLKPNKKLVFYPTTYPGAKCDFDPYRPLTIQHLAEADEAALAACIVERDDGVMDFIVTD